MIPDSGMMNLILALSESGDQEGKNADKDHQNSNCQLSCDRNEIWRKISMHTGDENNQLFLPGEYRDDSPVGKTPSGIAVQQP